MDALPFFSSDFVTLPIAAAVAAAGMSAQRWRELLVDIMARGLALAPEMAVGDGALDF